MKFKVDDMVIVQISERKGIVEQSKHEISIGKHGKIESKKYLIDFGGSAKQWFNENDLKLDYEIDLNLDLELELDNIYRMIDKSLDERNFDQVKYYVDYRNSLNK